MTSHPPKFKFYLDENFPVPAGKFLRSLGHTVVEGIKILKKPGLSDKRHLVTSIRQKAILLAFDRDFRINPDLKEMIKKSLGVILIEATNTIKGKICCVSIDKIFFP